MNDSKRLSKLRRRANKKRKRQLLENKRARERAEDKPRDGVGYSIDDMEANAQKRPCGECRACCTTMGVVELNKPVGVTCKHVCAAGCAIYGKHPKSCEEWYCAWKMIDMMPDSMRPDRSGVMVDLWWTGKTPTTITEIKPDALKAPEVKKWIERFRASVPRVLIVPYKVGQQVPKTELAAKWHSVEIAKNFLMATGLAN